MEGGVVTISDAKVARSRSGRPPSTTRAELERVAFLLFDAHGFDETSVEQIAEAAGIARRTFFHYSPSKTDLVWGEFDAQLDRLRAFLDSAPKDLPMLEAIHQAVVDFNRLPPGEEGQHRRRLSLILGVPTLLANSTLRFAQWREVIAAFAARRLGMATEDLLPRVVGYSALGAAIAAYEEWLRRPDSNLGALLDEALGTLAAGFDHQCST
jgi:TetR/AcrR family transcriptional regulator, regulator of mycofactocin system